MIRHLVITLAALAACASSATAALSGNTSVGTGLSAPIFTAVAPGDPNRLYVALRGGSIRIIDLTTNTVLPTPFLSGFAFPSGTTLDQAGEGGFLGLAFHPDYATNGKFYVNMTIDDVPANDTIPFQTRILQGTRSANPDVANTSYTEVLRFDQPQDNHNAGWIGFSPKDNYLYISSGDGGSGDDLGTGHTAGTGNGQDITNNLLGKMLRVDVNGDDFPTDATKNYAIPPTNPFLSGANAAGDDEIWAYGLRNPFRNSFDAATGDLWIADVGQNTWEEINFQSASSAGGENYGWRLREGLVATPSGGVGGAKPPGNVDPVYVYAHGTAALQGNSVTGGTIYRGNDPSLRGRYFFTDANSDNIWSFDPANPSGTVTNHNTAIGLAANNASRRFVALDSDAAGNLYLSDLVGGAIRRLNTNQVSTADYDLNGVVDTNDHVRWVLRFNGTNATAAAADASNNGVVDAADYTMWRDRLPPPAASVPEPGTLVLAAVMLVIAGGVKRATR